jgi:hypothetical protein
LGLAALLAGAKEKKPYFTRVSVFHETSQEASEASSQHNTTQHDHNLKIIQSSIGPLQNIDHCINYVQ